MPRPLRGREDVSADDGNRRDFLYIATAATGGVVGAAAVWPLIDQMNPSKDVLALATIEVAVEDIEPGTQITVKWRGKPVFIRRRTPEEIAEARETPVSDLPDGDARNDNDPGADAEDQNRSLDADGEWLVMMGVCTHLGCVPLGGETGDFQGWFCPCHGSHYDISGRIRKGPAPENLPVPPAVFLDESTLKLG